MALSAKLADSLILCRKAATAPSGTLALSRFGVPAFNDVLTVASVNVRVRRFCRPCFLTATATPVSLAATF